MRRHAATIGLIAVLALLPAAPARALVLEGLGGWEGDTHRDGYGFTAVGTSLPLGPHVAVPLGVSASFLYYEYDSSGTTVSVRSPGASVTTGIRVSGPRGSMSVTGGGEARWERRDTDLANAAATTRVTYGAVVQTYDDLAISRRWQTSVFGVYVGAARYIVARAALRYQITNLDWRGRSTFFLGIEGVRQGNDQSDGLQGGGFAEWNFVPLKLSLGLHSGYKESGSPGHTHQPGQYFGTSFYRRF
jgi:hypothetical protein